MWDDFEEDALDECLWASAIAGLAVDLWSTIGAYGRFPIPPRTPVAGWWPGRPTLEDSALLTLRVAVSPAHVMRQHEEFICWELQQAGGR
jgi:hypothetical protein